MAPYTGHGKMYNEKTNECKQRKKKKEKERKKTLRRKEKLGTITPDERKELAILEAK